MGTDPNDIPDGLHTRAAAWVLHLSAGNRVDPDLDAVGLIRDFVDWLREHPAEAARLLGTIVDGYLNYTSNAWPLFEEVLGRSIRDLDGAPCSEVGGPLTAAVARIRGNLEEYRPLVLGGGSWGTPENASDFLEEIAQLCEMAPRGVLRVMA